MAPEVAALCQRRRLPWSEILALLGVAAVGTFVGSGGSRSVSASSSALASANFDTD